MISKTFDFSWAGIQRVTSLAIAPLSLAAFATGCSSSSSTAPAMGGDADTGTSAEAGGDDTEASVGAEAGAGDDQNEASVPRGDGGPNVKDSQAPGADASDGSPDQTCAPWTATGDHITDSATSLTWRRTLFGSENFSQATTACTGWGGRLPTEAEVLAFIQAATPCANTIDFPSPPSTRTVWSTTPDPQNASFYYAVYFDGTPPQPTPGTDGAFALCVKP